MDLKKLKVKGRLLVFTVPNDVDPEEFLARFCEVGNLTDNLKKAGAIGAIALTADTSVESLDDEALAKLGLQRIKSSI